MKKRNLLIAAGVVAAGVCIWLIARPSKGPKVLLETAPISHITIRNSVTATGTVEPVTQVEVGTQVSGIIDKLYADYNDQVKAGQLIAEMDKVTLQAELESAQAQLASSKTEYEYQTKNYARTKTLHEKQLVSDAEYDQAFYLYETARNAYEQSQAAMVKVKRNLGYATITSPIDGVVISRAVEEGQTVAAGFETPTLFTIANDLTQMQVVADVDEADIGQVADGQRVQFSVDAYPDDTFEGTVLQVRLEATTESNVVTYEVVSHGMVCCPFHSDNHPSMKLNDNYYYCFGCGANGDTIDLTAKLFDLNPRQAAEKLARGLSGSSQSLSGRGPSILLTQDRSVTCSPHWGLHCFANAKSFISFSAACRGFRSNSLAVRSMASPLAPQPKQ